MAAAVVLLLAAALAAAVYFFVFAAGLTSRRERDYYELQYVMSPALESYLKDRQHPPADGLAVSETTGFIYVIEENQDPQADQLLIVHNKETGKNSWRRIANLD